MRRTVLSRVLLVAALVAVVGSVGLGQQITLRVTSAIYSNATQPWWEDVIATYEAENPGVDVELTMTPWDDLLLQLQTQAAGGALPDVAIIGTRWLLIFGPQGLLLPLNDLLAADTKGVQGRFVPALFDRANIDGQILALPVAASARALYCNLTLLQAAGVDCPTNWDEALAAAQAVNDPANGIFGFGVQGKDIEIEGNYLYALFSFDGTTWDFTTNRATLDSPESVQALETLNSFIQAGVTPDPLNNNRNDLDNLFRAGRLAMWMTGPWLIGQLNGDNPSFEWKAAPIPTGTVNATLAVTDSIVIWSTSQHPQEAFGLLEVAFRPEKRIAFNQGEGFLPITVGEAEDPEFQSDPNKVTVGGLFQVGRFRPLIAEEDRLVNELTVALQEVYSGARSPEEALRDANERFNSEL